MNPLSQNTQPSQEAEGILNAVRQKVGRVPNIYNAMSHSPTVLSAALAFNEALAKGRLSPATREKIALAVGAYNQCDYCVSAHAFIGKHAGIDEKERDLNILGSSSDENDRLILILVTDILKYKGQLPEHRVENFIERGLDQELIVEVIAQVSYNIFTNTFNHIAETEVDFPLVSSQSTLV